MPAAGAMRCGPFHRPGRPHGLRSPAACCMTRPRSTVGPRSHRRTASELRLRQPHTHYCTHDHNHSDDLQSMTTMPHRVVDLDATTVTTRNEFG
ncbi:hypothetical protein GE21DRAFT_1103729 [Neurospora crassa]|nr:hypothetical protein GE21DRAFT_1103729 [Neurospora crassa]